MSKIIYSNLNLKIIKHWVFDLDNTLYPASSNLFSKIDIRMKKFIINKLNVKEDEAYALQKRYYFKYGTTLAGLMKNHNIEPKEFLDYVHDIDVGSLKKDVKLKNILSLLPGNIYIYTNGSKSHAINVMLRLGINNVITRIFDIENANYIPKPSITALKSFMKKFNINAEEAIFFEDIPKNLINPKKVGFQTVLIKSNSHPDNNTNILKKEEIHHDFVDYTSYNIT
ncbi:MAG: pyrimidine 5'-nucleotidase, partial [Alphaproteobacteria bacterium]